MSQWQSRIRSLAIGLTLSIVVPLAVVCAVEFALRAFSVGTPTEATRPCTVEGTDSRCDNFYFTRAFFPPGMLRTPRPYAFPVAKPAGTYRIFVLGESAAYGDPDPAYAFSRYLELMLKNRYPDQRFEVINTGITAINSHVIVRIAEDLAKYQPDLFIVYAGNNEVVGPYGAGTVFTSQTLSRPVIRASIFARSTRLGQLITSVATSDRDKKGQWHGMEMFLSHQVPAGSPAVKSVYRNFEANLQEIIKSARNAGAQVVVSTVATNLKDCAPFASLHRDGLSDSDLQRFKTLVEEGNAVFSAGSYANAIASYEAALRIDPDYADIHFALARALWMQGDKIRAKEHFVRAQDLDALRFRTDSAMNSIIRKSVRPADTGIYLFDAAEKFSEGADGGVPGSELFYEHVHLTPHGNYELARLMLDTVSKAFSASSHKAAGTATVLPEQECDDRLALTPTDRALLAGEVARRMGRPPFTNQSNHEESLAKLEAESRMGLESDPTTTARYLWAIQQNPTDHMLHLKYGMFLGHINRQLAIQQLRMSRPYTDMPFVAPDGSIIQ